MPKLDDVCHTDTIGYPFAMAIIGCNWSIPLHTHYIPIDIGKRYTQLAWTNHIWIPQDLQASFKWWILLITIVTQYN